MKVCDHCRKSFLGWAARQKKSSSSRPSSSPASSEGVGHSESHHRSRGHSESHKPNRRSSSSSLSSPDDIFDAPITLPIPSAGKLFESAKEGLHSALEAATSGMHTHSSPDSGRYEDMESPANYLVTIGMIVGIFAAIGILLSYIIS